MSAKQDLRNRRRERLRFQLRQKSHGRPRLSVFRSGKNISAQIIDDAQGVTLAAASSLEGKAKGSDKDAAARIGKLIAERAIEKGVKDVVFDRGGYIYHGRIKALADAAREAGLNFKGNPWPVNLDSAATGGTGAIATATRAIAISSRSWSTSTASPPP